MAHLVIGTRSQQLALGQAGWVKTQLERLHPGLVVGLEILPGNDWESWQSEVREALQARRVDAIVHQLSSLPPQLPDDFHLAAVTERAETRDALVVRDTLRNQVKTFDDLPAQAKVAVATGQRRAQLIRLRDDLVYHESTAEIETDLQQLAAGTYDALVVPAFSLHLLQQADQICQLFELTDVLPAAGQGALALESQLFDQRTNLLLEALNHWPTRHATNAERALLRNLSASVNSSLAVHAQIMPGEAGPQLQLKAWLPNPTTKKSLRGELAGELRTGETLGATLALQLLANGAGSLLKHDTPIQSVINELFPAAEQTAAANGFPATTSVAATNGHELTHSAETAGTAPDATSVEQSPIGAPALPLTDDALPLFQTSTAPVFDFEIAREFDIVAARAHHARTKVPLREKRILIARAARQNAELIQAIESLGGAAYLCPTARDAEPVNWESLDRNLQHLSWFEWITFATPASVSYFLNRLSKLGVQRTEVEARRLCAVGDKTAARLRESGLEPDLVVTTFTAQSMAAELIKKFGVRERLRGATMLLVASQGMREQWRPALDKFGMYVEAVEAYRMALSETGSQEMMADLRANAFDYVIFNGESSIENLAVVLDPEPLAKFLGKARVLCTNAAAQAAAKAHGLRVHLTPADTGYRGVVRAIKDDCLAFDAETETDDAADFASITENNTETENNQVTAVSTVEHKAAI